MMDRSSMHRFWAPFFQIWLMWAIKVTCTSRSPLMHCAAMTQRIGFVNVRISLSDWDGSYSVNKKNSDSSPPVMATVKKNSAMYQ
jgi:hypothetical protein